MTPAQRVIKSRNEEVVRAWNRARFRCLAMALKLTEEELGEMAYVPTHSLRRYLKDNKFPPPVAGHLENIEQWNLASIGVKPQKTGQDEMLIKIKDRENND